MESTGALWDLLFIEATPTESKLIDQRHVSDDSTWAHLAVAGNEVCMRRLNGLITYEWKYGPQCIGILGSTKFHKTFWRRYLKKRIRGA